MKSLLKWGGFAALYEGTAYVLGMLFFLLIVDYSGVSDQAQKMEILTEYQSYIYVLNNIIYIFFGIALVILTISIYQLLKNTSPIIIQTASVFGFIWAVLVIASGMISNIGLERVVTLAATEPDKARSVWYSIETVADGIGGGNEIIGGIWIMLISLAAWKSRTISKPVNILGLIAGFAGIITTFPSLGEAGGIIFGLVQIIWFFWLGYYLLRYKI